MWVGVSHDQPMMLSKGAHLLEILPSSVVAPHDKREEGRNDANQPLVINDSLKMGFKI